MDKRQRHFLKSKARWMDRRGYNEDPNKYVVTIYPRKEFNNFRQEYEQYLTSHAWKEFRRKAFAFYGKKCILCDSTTLVEVHHKHYRNFKNEKIEDVIPLCQKCHAKHHGTSNNN